MATREFYNDILPEVAMTQQTISTNTTTAGEIIDTAKYDGGIMFVIFSGTLTDGTYTPLIQDGDDSGLSDAAVVADKNIVPVNVSGTWYTTGQEAAIAYALTEDDTVKAIAVVGTKRYVRLSLVSAATSSGGVIGAIALKKGELKSVYGL
jgi:hypothetical protein